MLKEVAMKDKKSLLNDIRALDFALLETGLYLNAYDCPEAVAYFNATKEAKERAVHAYESEYGPLLMKNAAESGSWQWTKGPWPWESEAN